MKTARYLLFAAVCTWQPVLAANVDCSPRAGGGYSCFDYDRGTFIDITPRYDGGYNTFDYGTGRFGTVRPKPGGGFRYEDY